MTETLNPHRPPTDSPEDAHVAYARMEEYIETNRLNARGAVRQVFEHVPVDRIVSGRELEFYAPAPEDGGPLLVHGPRFVERIHDNALQQIADKADLPVRYARDLAATDWGRSLLAENVTRLFRNKPELDRRFLTRSMDGQVRGFLSDKYRRLDSRPLLDALMGELQKVGAIISEGFAGDVRVSVKAILPIVQHPAPGEYLIYGLQWTNSDFGRGAQELTAFLVRLWCMNRAIMTRELRQVHLGARLADDLTFSQRTYELDTEATASAIRDVTQHLLGPATVERLNSGIRAAKAREIDPDAMTGRLRAQVSKAEAEAIKEAYRSADVVNLPAGNDAWRYSNAISWLANNTEDVDRRHDLQKIAGDVLDEAAAA